jgi:hypothetical protein
LGQLKTVGSQETLSDALERMAEEVHDSYSKLAYLPMLYETDDQRLLGHYGVVKSIVDGELKEIRFRVARLLRQLGGSQQTLVSLVAGESRAG